MHAVIMPRGLRSSGCTVINCLISLRVRIVILGTEHSAGLAGNVTAMSST